MFNLCFSVCDINFGHLRIQYSVPILFRSVLIILSQSWLSVFYLRTPLFPPFHFSSQANSVSLCGCLGYREHFGNRELCRSVSLLLTPTFSPPAHLYVPPPSPLLHVTLWTSLGVPQVENLFTFNLEVLLSVLYSWRSLETTGRIKLKSRGRRLKPKTWKHQKTPNYTEH